MSARATVIIRDSMNTLYFYRHSDGYPSGYPECAGESLKKFVKDYESKMRLDAIQSAGWLVLHGHTEYGEQPRGCGWKVGAYEPCSRLHNDVEYIYVIDLENKTLTCRQTKNGFWHDPKIENTVAVKEYNHKIKGN